MVTLTSQSNSVKFTFTDNDHYLFGTGEIEVPINSLYLVEDESDMVTFSKIDGDPFISFRADNSNLGSKSAIETFFKENMVGATGGGGGTGSGMTPSEVQEMIDESLEDYYDKDEIDSGFSTVNAAISAKTDNSAFTAHTANTHVHVTSQDKYNWNNKSDFSGDYNDLTNKPTIPVVPTSNSAFTNDMGYITHDEFDPKEETIASAITDLNERLEAVESGGTGGGISSGEVQTMIDESVSGKADTTAVTAAISAAVSTKADTTTVNSINGTLTAHTADTTIHVSSAQTTAWDAKANIAHVTQAQYDAMKTGGTLDQSTVYIIDDAVPFDPTTKADTSALTAVNDVLTAHTANTGIHVSQNEKNTWNGKQNSLTAGTGIDITNDVISVTGGTGGGISSAQCQTMIEDYCDPKEEVIATALNDLNDRVEDLESGGSSVTIATAITSSSTNDEAAGALATYNAITAATTGGGATYSAGTNISIDTANTISCTLRASNGTGNGSLKLAPLQNTNASGVYSVAAGYDTVVSGNYSFGAGRGIKTNNYGEAGFGFNNKSNGTSSSLGNNSGNTLFSVGNGQGTSPSDLHNAFEIRQNGDIYVNDGTNDVRLQDTILALGGLKFVKLTQSEYDQLATKDANTLYIITNVVS